jgi:RNA polymerase sigma factor (sigma-70 family)
MTVAAPSPEAIGIAPSRRAPRAVFKGDLNEEKALLSLVIVGDRSAQRELCRRLSTVVRGVSRKYAHRVGDDVGDLCQSALEHMLANNWAALQRWPKEGSLMSWAAVIARHHMIDELRREGRGGDLFVPSNPARPTDDRVEPDQDTVLEVAEARDCVQTAKAQLNVSDRKIISLRHAMGLKHREIATALRTTIGSVGSMLARAEAKLRRLVETNCRDHLPTLAARAELFEID